MSETRITMFNDTAQRVAAWHRGELYEHEARGLTNWMRSFIANTEQYYEKLKALRIEGQYLPELEDEIHLVTTQYRHLVALWDSMRTKAADLEIQKTREPNRRLATWSSDWIQPQTQTGIIISCCQPGCDGEHIFDFRVTDQDGKVVDGYNVELRMFTPRRNDSDDGVRATETAARSPETQGRHGTETPRVAADA